MAKVLCSTGALIGIPNNRDHRLLLDISKDLNCDGYEFMMYSSWYDHYKQIASDLKQMKLYFPVMYCEKRVGQAISTGETDDLEEAFRLFELNCEMASEIGAEKMVVHLWDGLISDAHFENNLAAFGKLVEIANKYYVDVLVENVVCNQANPMLHWCELRDKYPNIHFVYDTKMAAFHEEIDLLYQEEYSWLWKDHHIQHYHVNDYAGQYKQWDKLKTLPIGEGHIDFDQFFRFVKKTGYEDTFTVEATAFDHSGKINTDMLNRCFQRIRENI
jgi:sugar phosphate isomerase/epimerase